MRLVRNCLALLTLVILNLGSPTPARADMLDLSLSGQSALTGGETIHDMFNTATGDGISAAVADLGNNQTDVVLIDFAGGPNYPRDYGSLQFASYYPPTALAPGSYPNATRGGGPGSPALDVTFRSSGFNTSTGSFDITRIDLYRDAKGVLQLADFTATFVLYGDGSPDALNGSVNFVSSAVPEPSPVALFGVGLACLAGWAGVSRLRSGRPGPASPAAAG